MKKVASTQLTKIVATIGPATETEKILAKLIKAGMSMARFNTKHGTPEWHLTRMKRARKVADEIGIHISILLDLQGPEIRINLPRETNFEMTAGEKAVFTSNTNSSADNLIFIPQNVIKCLKNGDKISIDDGICEFEIIKNHKNKYLVAKALGDFTVKHRKTLNTPGVVIDMPSLTENDLKQLDSASNELVDYVGLSFVRNKEDIRILKKELKKRNLSVAIMSKIENQASLDNLDEIIEESDSIMVARGDLAVETPFEQLAYWQKLMIEKCRIANKPVIVATQMLESMIVNPLPTRAEICDVANSILDCTDAVMLSGESALGKYPVKCVATLGKIAAFNEKLVEVDLPEDLHNEEGFGIADAAAYLLRIKEREIDAVLVLSKTGKTAAHIIRIRPKLPVHVVTDDKKVANKMALYYAVVPHVVEKLDGKIKNAKDLIKKLAKYEWLKKGQTVLVVHGDDIEEGVADTMSVVKIT